jgi:peptidoglycan hydrolase CwlO-like protein
MAKEPEEIHYSAADVRRMRNKVENLKYYLEQEKSGEKKNQQRIEGLEQEIKNLEYLISGRN